MEGKNVFSINDILIFSKKDIDKLLDEMPKILNENNNFMVIRLKLREIIRQNPKLNNLDAVFDAGFTLGRYYEKKKKIDRINKERQTMKK